MPTTSGTAAADIGLWTLYAFIIGRVVGTGLMYRFRPENLLIVFSAASAVLTAAAFFARGWPGIWCVVGASFFMSILFPTIFGIAVRTVGKSMKSASALLIMAGGTATVSLPIMNVICGSTVTPYVVLLPSLCFGLITAFAVMHRNTPAEAIPQIVAVPS
jgi:FHS family L-fucose permease-like MFS transporter